MKKTNFLLAVFALTGLLSGCAGNQSADSSSSAPPAGTAPETTIAAFTTAVQDSDKPSIPGALLAINMSLPWSLPLTSFWQKWSPAS